MNKRLSGVTLIELIVAVILLSVIILAVMSIDTFGRYHLIGSDRRSRLQNKVAYALEHMQKNIALATGNFSLPTIQSITNGFRVRVDPHFLAPAVYLNELAPNTSLTASIYPMYTWVSYVLNSTPLNSSSVPSAINYSYTLPNGTSYSEDLATNVVSGVVAGQMPANPTTTGFYIFITDPGTGTPVSGTAVEVGLVGRWDPTLDASSDNPQVVMKTKVYATSASAK
jgi:Tfp pilus assembly protein PilW